MALLASCSELSKTFSSRTLFRGISLTISEGDRIGLIGPNGSGKSTLLKILAGRETSDSGEISLRRKLRIGYMEQDAALPPGLTAQEVVEAAIADEAIDEAERASRISQSLGRAGFTNGDALSDALSGGWKRRLTLARELVQSPDVLFLDEPTNHLDLESILWLEKLLASSSFASVIVSHDRYFLDNIATSIIEIDRVFPGGMFRAEGNYSAFLEKKEQFLLAQQSRQESLANKVRREVEWLRRGPKARTGKSRARIDEAGRLMNELSDLETRSVKGVARIDFTATGRRTKRLVSVEGAAKSLGGKTLFSGVDFTLPPGARLGLLGRNGTGKTTLLRAILGEIAPDAGLVERADGLRIVYFDQAREQLDLSQTLREGLGAHGDTVIFQDRPIHVAGWARRFLFDSDQLGRPLASFSGGERARVLIARLMLEPADLLLLDEPANDLDIPTLETLEESLLEFAGAMVMVTHDRYLLDRVCTAVLGLDGSGGAQIYADYWQWLQSQAPPAAVPRPAPAQTRAANDAAPAAALAKKKLSYLEAREWESMESRILEAESELEAARADIQSPEVVSDGDRLRAAYARLQACEARVAELYERWAELEAKR
jgi:ATP-binding cassette subfamily F protein uup